MAITQGSKKRELRNARMPQEGTMDRHREWNFEEDERPETIITAALKAVALFILFMAIMVMSAAFI